MLWTCPKCQTQNPEASGYCQTCGERKIGKKPLKTIQALGSKSTTATSKSTQRMARAEQLFQRHLRPVTFDTLDLYAAISKILGIICYVGAVCLFILGLMNGEGFVASFISSFMALVGGFSFHIVSEIISLFLQGQESWYLTSKYTYVNSELTNELLTKIEDLENQIAQLSNKEPDSKA